MEKDIESIRAERDLLASRISRFSVVSVLVLALLAAAVSRIDRRINDREVREIADEIAVLQKISQKVPNSFNILKALPKGPDSALPQGTAGINREAAAKRQEELEARLDGLVNQWFTLEASILGTHIDVDVRFWLALLPFSYSLGWCYLFLLRRKRAVVLETGARQVAEHPESATPIDRLRFSRELSTPYERLPGQLESGLYAFALGGLTIYLIFMAWRFRVVFDGMEDWLLPASEALLLSIAFVAIYGLRAAAALERQAQGLLGIALKPGPGKWLAGRCLRAQQITAEWMARRPRPSLAAASALVLLSLVLATALSCGGDLLEIETATGGEWIRDSPHETVWPTTFMSIGDSEISLIVSSYLDRGAYGLGLSLAVISLVLSLSPWLHRARGGALNGLARLSFFVWVYFWCDFAFVFLLSREEGGHLGDLRQGAWMIPFFFWWRDALSNRRERRARWKGIRFWLSTVYLAGSISSFLYYNYLFIISSVQGTRLWGYASFLLGTAWLSATYLALANRKMQYEIRRIDVNLAADTE